MAYSPSARPKPFQDHPPASTPPRATSWEPQKGTIANHCTGSVRGSSMVSVLAAAFDSSNSASSDGAAAAAVDVMEPPGDRRKWHEANRISRRVQVFPPGLRGARARLFTGAGAPP